MRIARALAIKVTLPLCVARAARFFAGVAVAAPRR